MARRRRRSNRGRLIKGMTRKLPYELLSDKYFIDKLKDLMKGYGGIYALYNGDNLYYVGLSKDLFGRLNWHLKDRHRGKWNRFIIFRIHKVNYLKDIETLLLHIVDTKGNRIKGGVPRDNDFNIILRNILKERGKEYKKLKKVLA